MADSLRPSYAALTSSPEQTGFFWARWIRCEPGTRDGILLPIDNSWIVVQVFENANPGCVDHLLALVPGVEIGQSLRNFEWGPGPLSLASH